MNLWTQHQSYREAIEKWKEEFPDLGYTSDLWWEQGEYKKSSDERKAKEEKEKLEVKDAVQLEKEEIAKEWVKRQYYKQTLAGTMNMTVEEFTESVWEQALVEGDVRYRKVNSGIPNEKPELMDFEEKHKRMMDTAYKRAVKDIKQALNEDIDEDADSQDKTQERNYSSISEHSKQ